MSTWSPATSAATTPAQEFGEAHWKPYLLGAFTAAHRVPYTHGSVSHFPSASVNLWVLCLCVAFLVATAVQ